MTAPADAQDWYRALFESANDAMLVLDQAKIIECNAAALRLFGREREALLGLSLFELSATLHSDEEDNVWLARAHVAEAQAGRPQRFDWEVAKPDGSRAYTEVTLRRARAAGEHVLVAVLRDASERRSLEVALRASERTFRAAFRKAPFGACILDTDGAMLEVNDALVALFGVPRELLIGQDLVDAGLLTQEEDDALRSHFLSAGSLSNHELELRTATGRKIVAASASRVEVDDEVYVLATVADISELKAAQRELLLVNEVLEWRFRERTAELERAISEREQALGQLVRSETLASLGSVVAGVAHELNTPLGNALTIATAFVSKVEEFRSEFESGALRRSSLASFVETATDGAILLAKNLSRAHELIASFKQVAVDQTSVRRRRFDLLATAQEVLATLQHMLRSSTHTIKLEIPPGIELDSYPGPVQQVLTNLINNSLVHGFVDRERGTILIRAEPKDAQVHLRFEDDSVGMSPAVARRAFEPFFTTTLGQGGSGLGLYLVYNLVTVVLGGTISLHDARPGARFEITLPLSAPENAARSTRSEFPPKSES